MVISLLAVQTLELTAMASIGTPDLTNPSVVVSNFADLQEAINIASDGTVIGIDSLIPVDSPNAILGNEDGNKHVYLVRMNADAYLWLTQISNLTMSNITIDGNSSITGNNPMLFVDGTLNLNNSVIQNCSGVPFGAVYVTDNGTLNAVSTKFNNNSAVSGGHIENHGTATISGCSFTNGSAQEFDGAISNARNLTVQNCKIVGNRAGLIGGGIQNDDCLSISQSVIYGNSAIYGNDVANTVNYSMYTNDNLADVMSLYQAEGISPVEWRYDGPVTEEELNQAGIYTANVYNPQSLLQLICESDEDTGDTEEDNTQNGGSSDDTSDSASDGNVTNNYYDQSSTTTNNSTTEDNSSVTNNTDNYEDKSSSTTTTTTTNNYYTYNTPQGSNATENTGATKTSDSGSVATVLGQKTETVSGNSTSESANVQLPDNLTLDLHGVDVSYEIVDGVPKIVISNDKVTEQTEATTRTMEQQPLTDNAINTASVTTDSENTSVSVNWYEIVKMALLAAILIVVIYKPSAKKGAITAVD